MSSVTGTVVDESGGAIGGAQITATDAAGAIRGRTMTSDAGSFTITGLTPGSYVVQAEKILFDPARGGTMHTKAVTYFASMILAPMALTAIVVAHAKLEKATPADGATVAAAPSNVELVFNEALDLKLTKIDVTGPSGKVELGPVHSTAAKSVMARVNAKLEDGKYTVSWQTAGDDGHVVKGEFSFTVKQAK